MVSEAEQIPSARPGSAVRFCPMASDPSLKDVVKLLGLLQSNLDAVRTEVATDLARVEGKVDSQRSDLARVEGKVDAQRSDLARVEGKVDAHRDETRQGFADLDDELTKHAATHATLEKDVAALKRRAAPRPAAARAARPRRSR